MNAPRSNPLGPFRQAWQQHQALFTDLLGLQAEIEAAAQAMHDCLAGGGKLMFCGNGGSAADSQHLAAELMGRFVLQRPPAAALALSTDTSVLTCISNDYSFAEVFERQVQGLGRRGDCLIGISSSGQSDNVLRACTAARQLGITSIGLLGGDGGRIVAACDQAVVVPSHDTARVQEAHIFIGHCWCSWIEARLTPAAP